MFNFLKQIFNKYNLENDIPHQGSKEKSREITKEMFYSLEEGNKLNEAKKYEEALIKFDIAVESGIHKDAYRERGYCLQILGFHLDAIDDFSKAIELFPNNANNYFGRSLSNSSLGYFENAITDATIAVGLSLIKSKENDYLEQMARDKNILSPTELYENYLTEFRIRADIKDELLLTAYIKPSKRRNATLI